MKYQLPSDLTALGGLVESVLKTEEWAHFTNQFMGSREVFFFGNGGNLSVLCHWISDFKSAGIRKRFFAMSEITHFSKIAREAKEGELYIHAMDQEIALTSNPLLVAVCSSADSAAIMNLIGSDKLPHFQKTLFTFCGKAPEVADLNHIDLKAEYYHQGEIALLALGYELIRAHGYSLKTVLA